jgi:haloalkane dehalogenase
MAIEFERTPDEAFAQITDFPYEPHYREVDGLRMAHVDAGSGDPVVFLHGEPTWSYLWRKVIPPVLDAGFRCIAPDLAGFGRSDKPVELGWYTVDRHADMIETLFDDLDLTNVTLVVHDWGGAIGFRIASRRPDRISRLVISDTGLFNGEQGATEAWRMFRDFVERTEDLPVGFLVRGGCGTDPGDEVAAAYDAPFANPRSKAGARAFPLILPVSPESPGADIGARAVDILTDDSRPRLVVWADSDPIVPIEGGYAMASRMGNGEIDHILKGAGHFLQEDCGEEFGKVIADWLRSEPGPRTHRR